MGTRRVAAAVLVLAIVAAASFTVYEVHFAAPAVPCQVVRGGATLRSQTSAATFGAVTEYKLPGPDRWPNAVANASEGSVWFADQELPGVAHLFPGNGTLVEYAWPGYPSPRPPDCVPTVSVSGMAIWNGRVWAADEYGNVTVGLNPRDGSVVSVNSTEGAPFPYWLAVGPDGNLWFTSYNLAGEPTRLGKILPNMALEVIDLVGLGNDQPLQLDFVNSTFALLSTLNLASNSTTHGCVCTGHVYSFDPSTAGATVAPSLIGGTYTLRLPNSVSYSNGSVWVTQHAASSVVRYDFSSGTWTKYPTSTVPWIDTTLPYVVQAEGGKVWFNEHYANKIAMLDPQQGTLTEFSEANPPITDPNQIQNDLSISPAPGGLWFTSMSGNYVGFVNSSYSPGFSVLVSGNATAKVARGGSASFTLAVTGTWSRPLGVNASDSEDYESIPRSISIVPSTPTIQPGTSVFHLGVDVGVGSEIAPGDYTVAVTVTDGGVQQTAYLFLVVT